jgi:eukaryotic-like serine/threonine-protein kinase
MNPNPNREEVLFALALEKSAEKRAAFLDAMCDGNPALRQRLDALRAAHEQPETLLATQAETARLTIKLDLADAPDEAVGQTLGRYKLLERVGEGGCGVVYVAEQTEPVRRRVALKVIKLGMDTKQVVARFEAERQALAMMDHPNIAKVLDAGTTAGPLPHPMGEGGRRPGEGLAAHYGRPYFVMELVRGIPITQYCDQEKLSTRKRLDLFIRVCHAIQHAHQKGIIHRDIKPSNILVTLHDGVPVPKVIDFGIAKATEGRLTDNTVYTQLHQFIGTPAYMSPEQAEMSGLDIDTRSDIYSLGVLLYELLTGSTPFDGAALIASGLDGMRRTIREQEPARPSTRVARLTGQEQTAAARRRSLDASRLLHQLRGDLDWIVIKCLEKDRTRRYETANGLAADIRRHLENEPVVARPPSTAYRVQKAFRRNKIIFSAATAVGLALVIGLSISTWQTVAARKAQRETETARTAERQQRLEAQAAQQASETERARADAMAQSLRRQMYRMQLFQAESFHDHACWGIGEGLGFAHVGTGVGPAGYRAEGWPLVKSDGLQPRWNQTSRAPWAGDPDLELRTACVASRTQSRRRGMLRDPIQPGQRAAPGRIRRLSIRGGRLGPGHRPATANIWCPDQKSRRFSRRTHSTHRGVRRHDPHLGCGYWTGDPIHPLRGRRTMAPFGFLSK